MISFMENLKMELAKRERRVEEALKEAELKRDQSEKECIAAKEEAERVKKEARRPKKRRRKTPSKGCSEKSPGSRPGSSRRLRRR